jgi:hypothetical protein
MGGSSRSENDFDARESWLSVIARSVTSSRSAPATYVSIARLAELGYLLC